MDLVEYHYYYAEALLAPMTGISGLTSSKRSTVLDYPLKRSSALQTARFNYDILELIESGAPDIRWLADNLAPLGSHAAIYPHGSSVCTELLDASYFNLLESLDGKTTAGTFASQLGMTKEEATRFLQFALQQGFVVL